MNNNMAVMAGPCAHGAPLCKRAADRATPAIH